MNPRSVLVHALTISVLTSCAVARPPEANVIDPSEVPARAVPGPHAELVVADDRFPAGPGVVHMKDDLEDAKARFDYRDPYDKQLATARRELGIEGTPITGGVVFRGVGPKNPTGPFDCFELAVLSSNRYAQIVQVDRRLCGLPYRDEADKPYTGPGPRWTLARMKKVIGDAKTLPAGSAEGMARARLGDSDTPGGKTWSAIGPRDDAAPITCHVLSIDDQGDPHIDKKDLSACGITWPPPESAFERDEKQGPVHASTAQEECTTRCTTNDACHIRRVAEKGARIVERGDDLLAVRLDGRPSRIDVTTTCVPIPPQCQPVPTAMCLMPTMQALAQGLAAPYQPRPGGPPPPPPVRSACSTPQTDDISSTFNRAPSGRWTLTCNTKLKN